MLESGFYNMDKEYVVYRHIMTGRHHSEETKRLMSELAKERRKNGARS